MTVSHEQMYSGTIDWNGIYRNFYPLPTMVKRIEEHLDVPETYPVVFSGFAELANTLAQTRPLRFVEYSQFMADAAQREFPSLRDIVNDDILDLLLHSRAPVVLIVCRISAYWQNADFFNRFLQGIAAYPRQVVLVDFFDAERLDQEGYFETIASPERRGVVEVTGRNKLETIPEIELARIRGQYIDGGDAVEFETVRAFYYRQQVMHYVHAHLPQYNVSLHDPIVPGDPGFLLKLSAVS